MRKRKVFEEGVSQLILIESSGNPMIGGGVYELVSLNIDLTKTIIGNPKIFIESLSYSVRIVKAASVEFLATDKSRMLLYNGNSLQNPNNNFIQYYSIDGIKPQLEFNKPMPINNLNSGLIPVTIKVFPNQVVGYVFAAGDEIDVDLSIKFHFNY